MSSGVVISIIILLNVFGLLFAIVVFDNIFLAAIIVMAGAFIWYLHAQYESKKLET